MSSYYTVYARKERETIERFIAAPNRNGGERPNAAGDAIASFPVHVGAPEAQQRIRTHDYCDFLNKQHAAMEEAAKTVTITSAVAARLTGVTP